MKDSIRLHKEHGLNPTMPVCFWCGKDTGEIALLGAAFKGEAPMRMVMDYTPCDSCKTDFAKGVVLVQVTEHPNTAQQPPIQGNLYPTGKLCVVTDECIERMFNEDASARVLKSRKAFLDRQAWKEIGLPESDSELPSILKQQAM